MTEIKVGDAVRARRDSAMGTIREGSLHIVESVRNDVLVIDGTSWPQDLFEPSEHMTPTTDPVNHPSHYTWLPNGVEVIDITKHLSFCLGNVVKYTLRADRKGNAIEDLKKAQTYLKFEIERREEIARRDSSV